jgi:hypothetical protein
VILVDVLGRSAKSHLKNNLSYPGVKDKIDLVALNDDVFDGLKYEDKTPISTFISFNNGDKLPITCFLACNAHVRQECFDGDYNAITQD